MSDKRISVCDEELEVEYFKADVLAAMDYYPFGMLSKTALQGDHDAPLRNPDRSASGASGMMPDRQWYANSDTGLYKFAFNGKELDREHGGAGNVYDYGFRIYNPALGRFLSVDPLFKSYPWYTPYQFAGNNPIRCIDLDGLESQDPQNPTSKDNGGVPSNSNSSGSGNSSGSTSGPSNEESSSDMTGSTWLKQGAYAAANPEIAISVGVYFRYADNLTSAAVRYTFGTGLDNTFGEGRGSEVNALRHAIWQALITRKHGYMAAHDVAKAHEKYPEILQQSSTTTFSDIEQADAYVDALNNITGRLIAYQNPNATNTELAMLVAKHFATKGLWVLRENDDGTYTPVLHKISADQLQVVLASISRRDESAFNPEDRAEIEKMRKQMNDAREINERHQK